MLAATGNTKVRAGFEPMPEGFLQVDAGDFDKLAGAVDAETAGIIMEPIQGEGGINLYPPDYPQRVRELCDKHGITLIFDEVWTGCGRTGQWFAHQYFAKSGGGVVEPDVMTLGKAVGGGLPVGVMYAKPEAAKVMVPGTHGCTLGGNPICMAVARTVFDVIERLKLLDHVRAMSEYAVGRLTKEPRIADKVAAVRGRGLMLGIALKNPPEKIVEKALERGIVMNLTTKQVIRLAPAVNIPRQVWEEGIDGVIETIMAA
jgi:acetylornithine aminotransferase